MPEYPSPQEPEAVSALEELASVANTFGLSDVVHMINENSWDTPGAPGVSEQFTSPDDERAAACRSIDAISRGILQATCTAATLREGIQLNLEALQVSEALPAESSITFGSSYDDEVERIRHIQDIQNLELDDLELPTAERLPELVQALNEFREYFDLPALTTQGVNE